MTITTYGAETLRFLQMINTSNIRDGKAYEREKRDSLRTDLEHALVRGKAETAPRRRLPTVKNPAASHSHREHHNQRLVGHQHIP